MTSPARARALRAAFLLAMAGLALNACGVSGEDAGEGSYTRDATAACLQSAGSAVSTSETDLDFVADEATGGGIHASVGGMFVTIAFGQTTHDAELTESAYRSVSQSFGEPVDEVISRHGNAVLRWDKPPTDDERSTAERCLS